MKIRCLLSLARDWRRMQNLKMQEKGDVKVKINGVAHITIRVFFVP